MRTPSKHLYHALPAAARLGSFEGYPAIVARELANLGVPSNLKPSRTVLIQRGLLEKGKRPLPQRSRALEIGCALILVIAIALMLIGLAEVFMGIANRVVEWVWP